MTCPVCKRPMIVLEVDDDVEVDFCVGCKGKWLDTEEMDLVLDGAENRHRIISELAKATQVAEARIACPICDKKMDKVRCTSDAEHEDVILDRCPKGHGLWFDEGELKRVLDIGDFPAEHRIYKLMSSIFGGD